MKITLITLALIFLTMNLHANENWIKIEHINKTKTKKPKTKIDVDLSQVEPINKMMKKATLIKQIIDVTSKKEKPPTANDKKWFVLNN